MYIGMRMPPMEKELGFEGVVEWARKNHFGSLDIPTVNRKVRNICDNAGIGIGTVDWGCGGGLLSKDGRSRRSAISAMKRCIRDTSKYGSGVIFVLLSPDDPLQSRIESFEIYKRVYPEIVDYAESNKVYLAIEPWPGPAPSYPNLGCTPETLRSIFEVTPSANIGICYDPSHFVRIGVDYRRLLIEFGDRVHHVHAKDTELLEDGLYAFGCLGQSFGSRYLHGEGWWRYCIPGWGIVDWRWVVGRLEEFGYNGSLSIELEDHRYSSSVESNQDGLLKAKEYLEEIIGRADE